MNVDRWKVYEVNGVWGAQVWFIDGFSVRYQGFDSPKDAQNFLSNQHGIESDICYTTDVGKHTAKGRTI